MRRDTFIIIAVLVLVTTGYFIFRDEPRELMTDITKEPHSMDIAMGGIDEFPQDYEGLVNLGNENMDHGNYPVAAECYKRALSLDSSSLDVRTDYGACLHGMGLLERARQEFGVVLKKMPEHLIANFNQGIVFYEMKLHDSARFYWEKYLVLDPDGQAAGTVRELLDSLSR